MKNFILRLLKRFISIRQNILPSPYSWLETICLVDDVEAERLNDWTVGYYHCLECETYQGFSFQLPPHGVHVAERNSRTRFWHAHAHGDARVYIFEKIIDE